MIKNQPVEVSGLLARKDEEVSQGKEKELIEKNIELSAVREALDVIADPRSQRLYPNPRSPHLPMAEAE